MSSEHEQLQYARPKGVLALCESGTTISLTWKTADLGELITEQATTPRVGQTLEQIQNTLSSLIGAELSPELIEQFGFGALDWQLINHKQCLDAVFVGAPRRPGGTDKSPISLHNALGVVWLSATAEYIDKNDPPAGKKIAQQKLHASGIGIDSGGSIRAAAAEYWLDESTPQLAAHRIDVSASDQELPALDSSRTDLDPDHVFWYNNAKANISGLLFSQKENAGLITHGMRDQTGGHTQVLKLVGSEGKFYTSLPAYNPGFGVSPGTNDQALQYTPHSAQVPEWEMPLPSPLRLSNSRNN